MCSWPLVQPLQRAATAFFLNTSTSKIVTLYVIVRGKCAGLHARASAAAHSEHQDRRIAG